MFTLIHKTKGKLFYLSKLEKGNDHRLEFSFTDDKEMAIVSNDYGMMEWMTAILTARENIPAKVVRVSNL